LVIIPEHSKEIRKKKKQVLVQNNIY